MQAGLGGLERGDGGAPHGAAAAMQRVEAVVFWLEAGRARHRRFVPVDGAEPGASAALGVDVEACSDPLAGALAWCEALRRRAGDDVARVSHVCLSTQVAGDATRRGVSDERPADYGWTKRRSTAPAGRGPRRGG